jgi:hypothetical protein
VAPRAGGCACLRSTTSPGGGGGYVLAFPLDHLLRAPPSASLARHSSLPAQPATLVCPPALLRSCRCPPQSATHNSPPVRDEGSTLTPTYHVPSVASLNHQGCCFPSRLLRLALRVGRSLAHGVPAVQALVTAHRNELVQLVGCPRSDIPSWGCAHQLNTVQDIETLT